MGGEAAHDIDQKLVEGCVRPMEVFENPSVSQTAVLWLVKVVRACLLVSY